MGKRGLKRAVEELVGDGTRSRYVVSFRVPDLEACPLSGEGKGLL